MAQVGTRSKHSRQPSKLLGLGGEGRHRRHETDRLKTNDEATIQHIKRVLCRQPTSVNSPREGIKDVESKSLEELLPPLTSSNDVDLQLYAIIAVILNQFVQSWYSRITPDHDFVAEIVQIIAHCTRGIEERFRQVNLEELVLDELPNLLLTHLDAVTVAQQASSSRDGSRNEMRSIYHAVRPHQALTPVPESPLSTEKQQDNEIAWSQLLVSRILPLVLPPEDLQNPCLHVLVSEIFSEMIVRNAMCGHASHAWVLWEGVTKFINSLRPDFNKQRQYQLSSASAPETATAESNAAVPINRLEQFGLLSSAGPTKGQDRHDAQQGAFDAIAQVFWTTLQIGTVVWLLLRSLADALMHASSIPARSNRGGVGGSSNSPRMKTSDKLPRDAVDPDSRPSPQHTIPPVISMKVWACISRLTSLDQKMPWFSGFLALLQWFSLHGPGRVCETNAVFDRLMSQEFNNHLRHPALLPKILLATRSALFPDNALAPMRQPPTAAQVLEIKRDCARTIVETVPLPVRTRYFATKDEDLMRQDVERNVLDLFEDSYINKHLVISAVELVIVRLFPELAEEVADDY